MQGFALGKAMTGTADLNVSAALDADHQGIERRCVFAEPLAAVEGKQGDAAAGVLHKHAAYDSIDLSDLEQAADRSGGKAIRYAFPNEQVSLARCSSGLPCRVTRVAE
jgi:hypothetical protein